MRAVKVVSVGVGLVMGMAAAGCSASSVPARQQAGASDLGGAVVDVQSADAAQQAVGYWTAARMKAAKPLSDSVSGAAMRALVARPRPAGGTQVDIAPVAPVAGSQGGVSAAGAKQATWKRGGAVAKTAGKLFGVGDGGVGFSASANVVRSKDGDVVITVGHALRTPTGKWTTKLVFVPGYKNGKAPYGRFPVRKKFVPVEYVTKDSAGKIVHDRRYDFGAVAVAPVKGKKVQKVVGGQGITFNVLNRPYGYLFGYPRNGNNGQTLRYCSGANVNDPAGVMPHGMRCDMNFGSSGGPWFRNFNAAKGTGYQISVHAARTSTTSYGPYFGASVLKTFRAAERA